MDRTCEVCGQRVFYVLCYGLLLVSLAAFPSLDNFLDGVLHTAGFLLTESLLARRLEHCFGCDVFFGVSLTVVFSLCHGNWRVDNIVSRMVIVKSGNQIGCNKIYVCARKVGGKITNPLSCHIQHM